MGSNVHAHCPLSRRCLCTCALVIYHHLPNMFLKLLNLWINNFSLEQFNSRKSLSTEQDLNLHPSVSGWVPLPLDHLHSCFSLLFKSYPRASIVSNPGPWHIAHVHCMHRVLWDPMCMHIVLFQEDAYAHVHWWFITIYLIHFSNCLIYE